MKRFSLLAIGLFLILTLAFTGTATADMQDCSKCHGTIISDFTVASPVPAQTCSTCHNEITMDPYHSYPSWIATLVPDAGYFKSASTALTGPPKIHSYHNGQNKPSNSGGYCNYCHKQATCESCHKTVGHKLHGNIPASTFPTYNVATGTSYVSQGLSCTLSSCHKFYSTGGVVTVRPDGQQLCLNCHTTDKTGHVEAAIGPAHESTANTLRVGAASYSVSCAGCHAGNLTTEHKTVAVRLNQPENAECGYCHLSTAQPAVAAAVNQIKTANKAVTDLNIKAQNRDCTKCHFNTGVLILPTEHPSLFHLATQSNNLNVVGGPHANCNICHNRLTPVSMSVNVNGTVYQKSLGELANMSPKNYSCLSCHNGDGTTNLNPKAPVHMAKYTDGTPQNVTGLHPGCNTCHDPNAVYTSDPTRKPVNDIVYIQTTLGNQYSCTDCHKNLSASHNAYYINGTERFDMNTTEYHRSCSVCHSNAKVSGIVKLLKTGAKPYNCDECHGKLLADGTVAAKLAVHSTVHQEAIVGYHPNGVSTSRCDNCHGQANFTNINISTWPASYKCSDCHNSVIAGPGYHQAQTDVNANPETISTTYHQQCSTCHGNSAVQSVIDTKKKPAPTSPYLCSDCHNGTNAATAAHQAKMQVSDTTAVGITGYHIDGTGAVSCGKCHGNPALPAETISILKAKGSYLCTDCHKDALAPVHSAALSQGGTAKPTVGFHGSCVTCHDKANVKTAITSGTFTGGYLCTTCHNAAIAPQPSHMTKADANAASENISSTYHPDCTTCHGNTAVAGLNDIIKQAAQNEETDYLCSKCHNAALGLEPKHTAKLRTTDTTESAITGYHVDSTGAVSCGKCHGNPALPAVTINTLKAQGSYMCTDCHKDALAPVHSAALSQGGAAKPTVGFHSSCQTCHNNANVKTAIASNTFAGSYLCATCHDAAIAPQPSHMAKADANSGSENVSSTYHPDCTTCHGNTAVPGLDDIIKNAALNKETDYLCDKCHNATLGLEPGHQAKFNTTDTTAAGITGYHIDGTGAVSCSKCHGNPLLPAGTITTLKAQGSYLCYACHKDTLAPTHLASDQTGGTPGDTVTLHSTCQLCHDKAGVKTGIEADMFITAYQCADCHDGGIASNYNTRHIDGNLDVGLVKCSWCHSSDLVPTHVNPESIAPAMVLNGTFNCNTCHAQDSIVKNLITLKTKECNGCHTSAVMGTRINDSHLNSQEMLDDHLNIFPSFGAAITGYNSNCADCHKDLRLTSLHEAKGLSCQACHWDDNYKNAVITLKTNCENCHNPDVDTKHMVSIDDRHKVPHNALALNAESQTCVNCHKTDLAAPDDTNLLTVHKKKAGSTVECSTCHGAGARQAVKTAIANKDVNCTSCHTGGGHIHSVAANGYAAAPNVDCSKCHAANADGTAELAAIHAAKVPNYSCGICHNPTFEGGTNPVIVKDGTIDMKQNGNTVIYCAACHDGVKADAIDKTSGVVKPAKYPEHAGAHDLAGAYGAYTLEGNVDCIKCHDSMGIAPVHDSATNPAGVTCNSCHASSNTAVGKVITDNWSRNSAPSGFTCADCHNTLPYKHAPEHLANQAESVTCSVCHDGTTVKGSFNIAANTATNVTPIHTSNDCNTCHSNANVQSVIDSKVGLANPTYTCSECHDGTNAKTHKKQHTVTSYLNSGNSTSCAGCHDADVAKLHSATTNATLNCDTCHGANPVLPNTKSTILANLSNKTATPNYTCESCHSGIASGHNHPVATNGYDAAPNVDCSRCHATNIDGTAELATIHQNAANAGKIANYSCSTCHNATFEGAGKAIVKDGTLDMKKNGTTIIYCADCHDGVNADSITDIMAVKPAKYKAHNGTHINSTGYGAYKGTYNGQAFDDSAADCSKCHTSLNTKTVHDSAVHLNVNCNSCHQSSNTAVRAVITGAWSRAASKATYTCSSCHNTLPYLHKPEHVGTSASAASLNCAGCHSAASWTGNNGQVVGIHNNNCNTCHASANSVVNNFITSKDGLANQPYACEGCHTTGGALAKEAVHKADHMAKHNATNMSCSSCHNFSIAAGTATDISSATIHKNGCNTCHGSTVRSDVKLVISSKLGQTNPAYACEDCHGAIHLGWEVKHKPAFPANQPAGDCSGCHNNYLPTEHTRYFGTSVSSIGYKVFRSATSTGPWTAIGSTTATGYADTGLAANTTYYYKVQAYDGKPNYSGNSNVVSLKTQPNTPVTTTTTLNPDLAKYASGNNGDSSSDPSSTTDALAKLTDNTDSTYYEVRENGSSDQYVFVKLNSQDAKNYTKVELKIRLRYYEGTNLTIYPYQSNGTSINTNSSYVVDGPSRSSSSSYSTETIDVTRAAQAMSGYGWMKFRIKPDPNSPRRVYIAEVQVVLSQSQNPVSGGTATNPPGTLAATPNDTTAPTAPSGLTGTANYYDRVDLSWTVSTDTGTAAGEADTCVLCHSSTARQQVKDAVTAKNANCSACHTIHANITTAHTGPALATTPWNCSVCHTNVLSVEHSVNAALDNNHSLNCNTCHKSTLGKVTTAIKSTVTDKSNLNCTACHTGTADGVPPVHSDLAAPHLSGIFPTANDAKCLNCHASLTTAFSASSAGYHAVNGLPSKAGSLGGYINGWTATSPMTCQSCHGSDGIGPTTAYANILKKPFSATTSYSSSNDLCFLCHDRATYGSGGSSSGKTGFRTSGGENLHTLGDHKGSRIYCVSCHNWAPHGGKYRMLGTVNDGAPFQSYANNIRIDRVTNGYSVNNCATNCGEHSSR